MEAQLNKIEEEMPIPDENIKSKSYAMSNSKLDTKDYSSHE